jgi:Fe-S cluster assembly ATP-binding protein
VTIATFLRTTLRSVRQADVPVREFRQTVKAQLKALGIPEAFMNPYVNDGFSGGEKKRLEILQLAVLNPALAVLDETDSGLDIDALKTVAHGINALRSPQRGILLITHDQRILNYVRPDVVHVMMDGRIARSGRPQLAVELEATGYEGFRPVAERLIVMGFVEPIIQQVPFEPLKERLRQEIEGRLPRMTGEMPPKGAEGGRPRRGGLHSPEGPWRGSG